MPEISDALLIPYGKYLSTEPRGPGYIITPLRISATALQMNQPAEVKYMDTKELQLILDASTLHRKSNSKEGQPASLGEANLHGLNLSLANLSEADLHGANLSLVNLRRADLRRADLQGANLYRANLYRVDLRGANLRGTNLRGANLSEANLSVANLTGADFSMANLSGANLSETNLRRTIGNGREICSAQLGALPIAYTSIELCIGCKQYPIEEWKNPSFLGDKDRDLWNEYSSLIWTILERLPAKKSPS
jgi:hypothetical protein